jgi:hypothetical protein
MHDWYIWKWNQIKLYMYQNDESISSQVEKYQHFKLNRLPYQVLKKLKNEYELEKLCNIYVVVLSQNVRIKSMWQLYVPKI